MKRSIGTQPLAVRFVVLTCAFILLTAVSAQLFFSRQARTDLEQRLQEKSIFINSFYSYLIADALVRKDDVTLLQVVSRLEQDEEITSVIVVDNRNEVRYHADPDKMGTKFDDQVVINVLKTGAAVMLNYKNSGGRALGIVSPLKIQGGAPAIGVVRIDLTFRRIDNQLSKPMNRYWFVVLGSLVSCSGLMMAFLNRWVSSPLDRLRASFTAVSTTSPDTYFINTGDEFGPVNLAAMDMVARFRNDMQQQSSAYQTRAEQEKAWIYGLARSLFPEGRILIVDKDNLLISDTAHTLPPPGKQRTHLLDLIKDSSFATLLADAFQKEGTLIRGPVKIQDKSFMTSILSLPLKQAIVVKTLIALQPTNS